MTQTHTTVFQRKTSGQTMFSTPSSTGSRSAVTRAATRRPRREVVRDIATYNCPWANTESGPWMWYSWNGHIQVGSKTPTRSKDWPWDLLIVMAHANLSGNWRRVNRMAISPVRHKGVFFFFFFYNGTTHKGNPLAWPVLCKLMRGTKTICPADGPHATFTATECFKSFSMTPRVPFIKPVLRERFLMQIIGRAITQREPQKIRVTG